MMITIPNTSFSKATGTSFKRATRRFLGLLLIAISAFSAPVAAQTASATWALTATANASAVGNITAAVATRTAPPTTTATAFDATNGWGAYAWPAVATRNPAYYYQFTITPNAGFMYTVSSLALTTLRGNANAADLFDIYYSTDGFTNSSILASAQSITTITSTTTTINSLSIPVTPAQTLSLRLYFYDAGGVGSAASVRIKNVVVSGVTTTLSGCTTPVAQPTALNFTGTTSTATGGSFTAPAAPPDHYLIVRSAAASLSATPVNGTTYAAGGSLGGGTIVQAGTSTSFTDAGLTANTTYNYFVFAYNGTCSGGPFYLTTVPLTGNIKTCTAAPATLTGTATTATTASIAFGTVTGATAYQLQYRVNGTTTWTTASPSPTTSPYALSGLTGNTVYDIQLSGPNSSCGTYKTVTSAFATPCANLPLPVLEGFNTSVIPPCWTRQNVVGSSTFKYVTSSTNPTTAPQEGARFVMWNSFASGWAAGNETRLVSPPITTTGTSSVDVVFYWFNENSASYNSGSYLNEGATVQYSLDGITWVDAQFFPRQDATLASGTGAWKLKTVTLPTAAGNQSTVYVGFKFHSEYGDNCAMDNVTVQASPQCTGTPSAGSITGTTSYCGASAATLQLSGYTGAAGIGVQWQSASALAGPYTPVSTGTGGTTSAYTSPVLTGDIYYQATVTCTNAGGGTATTAPVHVVVNNPQLAGTTPGTRCGIGTVALGATAAAGTTINWYNVATGGSSLGSGSSFTTPAITATTNYYAEPSSITSSGNIGQVSDVAANLGDDFFDDMYFAATQNTVINSVDVYPSVAGPTVISLYDNNYNLISSRSFTFTAADVSTTVKKTLALGFTIPAGSTGWMLEYDYNLNAGYNSAATYAYPASTSDFSITGNSYDGDNITAGTMYCFYNWNVSSGCFGARTLVPATVTPAPVITATSIPAAVCSGGATTLAASSSNSGYTYSWSNGGAGAGISVSPIGTTYPSSTATYTVTGTDNSGGANNGCVAVATATVAVNPGPAITSVTPGLATMVCGNALQPLTATATGNGTITIASGTITTVIPDHNATGITKTLSVSGVPAGAVIDSVIAIVTIAHAYDQDVQLNLKAPNGQIINLVSGQSIFSGTNFNLARFTSDNTKPSVSTNTTTAIKGTYKADAVTLASGFELAPTVMPTTANYSDLFTIPNGTWSINAVDDEAIGKGKLKSWSLKIAFHTAPAITWSPLTDLYTDAAGTTAYTGTAAATVYTAAHNNTRYIATATIAGGCTATADDSVQVNSVPANTLAMATTNANSWMIGFNPADLHTNACELIATVQPSGLSPVFGNVSSSVTISGTAGSVNTDAYVRRVYYIEPDINAANATATITLYATQADFDDCNAAALLLDTAHALLPTSSTGSTAKVRVMQYHDNGNPGSSPSGSAVITPNSITWDAANSRWALTFPVTGFSNFYIFASNTASPLPVKLIDLTATNEGSQNKIEWNSGVENGLDHYDVMRSRDGITFEKIDEVAAQGKPYGYIIYDKTPFTGINYYWLNMVAVNGDATVSNIVNAIVKGNNGLVLQAHPNPVSDLLTVDVENATTNAHITLTDVTGKVINTTAVDNNKATFQMSGLTPGIYYIRYTDNSRNQTIKINKQ